MMESARADPPAAPRVFILDALGYLALRREEASLLLLLVRRYERARLTVTSNQSFADWGEVFHRYHSTDGCPPLSLGP